MLLAIDLRKDKSKLDQAHTAVAKMLGNKNHATPKFPAHAKLHAPPNIAPITIHHHRRHHHRRQTAINHCYKIISVLEASVLRALFIVRMRDMFRSFDKE